MLKGDLASTPVSEVLRQLADGATTGCLHLQDPEGERAKVYLRGGLAYAVTVPGRRPQLGARLVSSGALAPEALAEALEAQRTELQGWRLGELLIHLGYVDQPVVEAYVQEQLQESASDLLTWSAGTWKFRVNERTREDVAPPISVADLLEAVASRQAAWRTITEVVHGPDAVPVLSASGAADAETAIDAEAWSLLCKVDGVRTLSQLAGECGFTLFEAGQVVHTLVAAGLLDVDEATSGPEQTLGASSVTARLAAAFAPSYDRPAARAEQGPSDELDVDETVERISAALSALLGPVRDDALFASRPRPPKAAPRLTESERMRAAREAERAERDAARRGRDAEELIAAQAELEAARADNTTTYADDHEAEIVDLSARREQAEAEEAAAAHAFAALAEADRVAAEERAATEERAAAQAEAERLTAETAAAAAEQAAAQAEEQRLADEAAAAEAQRLEAEQIAAREEAQRRADETAAAEAQRIAAAEQAAAAEAQRLVDHAAAAENQRLEADQAAAAEVQRLEAEQAAARAEAQRRAVEAAAAEAERVAAAEQAAAQRLEAEQSRQHEEVAQQLREAAHAQATAQATAQAVAEKEAADQRAQARADDEAERALAEQREQAASAFAELSAAAESAPDVTVVPDTRPAPDNVAVARSWMDDEPMNYGVQGDTDTAALMRELSSLGLDDEPTPAAASRPPGGPPRPPVSTMANKKKKGLFGRS